MHPFQQDPDDIIPEFESLIDQISDRFFNYEGRLFTNFAQQRSNTLKKLPWRGIQRPLVHYGGDYIVTTDEKDNSLFFFHFIIPGHDDTTIEVMQKKGYLIIRSKDMKKEIIDKNSLSLYNYYKKVPLSHENYEVTGAIFKNGILSISIKDKSDEVEKANTKMIEVRPALEN